MKSEDILNSLNYLPDNLIEQAAKGRQDYAGERTKTAYISSFLKPIMTAACVAAVVGISLFISSKNSHVFDHAAPELLPSDTFNECSFSENVMDMVNSDDRAEEDYLLSDEAGDLESAGTPIKVAVTLPQKSIAETTDSIEAEDYVLAFMYDGRTYTQYPQKFDVDEIYDEYKILDEKIGYVVSDTSKYDLPAIVTKLGTANFCGYVYTVKGFSPEFALAAKLDSGEFYVFFNDNGITLKNGGDIVSSRLNLTEHLDDFRITIDALSLPATEKNTEEVKRLLSVIEQSPVVHLDKQSTEEIDCTTILHFHLSEKWNIKPQIFYERLKIEVQLLKGGYARVMVNGFADVYIAIGEEALNEFTRNLEQIINE